MLAALLLGHGVAASHLRGGMQHGSHGSWCSCACYALRVPMSWQVQVSCWTPQLTKSLHSAQLHTCLLTAACSLRPLDASTLGPRFESPNPLAALLLSSLPKSCMPEDVAIADHSQQVPAVVRERRCTNRTAHADGVCAGHLRTVGSIKHIRHTCAVAYRGTHAKEQCAQHGTGLGVALHA